MTTTFPSEQPRSELDLFLGTGAWSEVTTDREGQRCVEQQQPGQEAWQASTLRAYFSDGGALVAMKVTDPAGEVTEMPAAVIAMMAAKVQEAAAALTHGTQRRSTRSR